MATEVKLAYVVIITENGIPSYYQHSNEVQTVTVEELQKKGIRIGDRLNDEEWDIDIYFYNKEFYTITTFNSGCVNKLIKI
jgi:hypothetical protein